MLWVLILSMNAETCSLKSIPNGRFLSNFVAPIFYSLLRVFARNLLRRNCWRHISFCSKCLDWGLILAVYEITATSIRYAATVNKTQSLVLISNQLFFVLQMLFRNVIIVTASYTVLFVATIYNGFAVPYKIRLSCVQVPTKWLQRPPLSYKCNVGFYQSF